MRSISMINPFTLEGDNKNFYLGLKWQDNLEGNRSTIENEGRFRNINRQLDQLSKKKQEMMFKEQQMNYIFNRRRPSLAISDFMPKNAAKPQHKFRVRSLLKQKKQSIHQFLNKKKQIYISNMRINLKQEERKKIENKLKDEQETLRAKQIYFDNDIEFLRRFISGLKKQTDDAQNSVDLELKIQQALQSRLNEQQTQIDQIDYLLSKDQEKLNTLKLAKQFIQQFYNQQRNWKKYVPNYRESAEVLFMTEGGAHFPKIGKVNEQSMGFVIQFQPQNMIEIFDDTNQENIRAIKNIKELKQDLEIIQKDYKSEKEQFNILKRSQKQKINSLLEVYNEKKNKSDQYQELIKERKSVVKIFQNEQLNVDKIQRKIFEIYRQINHKQKQTYQKFPQSRTKKQMAQIQREIEHLNNKFNMIFQYNPQVIDQIEGQIKKRKKKENLLKNQEENKKMGQKKQLQQQRKKHKLQQQRYKGRRDMQKIWFQKKKKEVKEIVNQSLNDDDKYLTAA